MVIREKTAVMSRLRFGHQTSTPRSPGRAARQGNAPAFGQVAYGLGGAMTES
jgi:hypothetical protein